MQLQLYAYFSHVRFTIFFGFQFSFTASDQALVLAQENIKKTASIDWFDERTACTVSVPCSGAQQELRNMNREILEHECSAIDPMGS